MGILLPTNASTYGHSAILFLSSPAAATLHLLVLGVCVCVVARGVWLFGCVWLVAGWGGVLSPDPDSDSDFEPKPKFWLIQIQM